MAEFHLRFGTEAQCIEALARWRWPDGFLCPMCGHDKGYRLTARGMYQCARCRRQHSATAGTLLRHTKLPLTKWFRGLYLIETCGEKAVTLETLGTLLDISYNAAWRMKPKLIKLMNDRNRPLRLDLVDPTSSALPPSSSSGPS